jgi:hypothetical protein
MDIFAAISLSTEPPSENSDSWCLEEKRKKGERVIIPAMWRNIFS